MSFAIMEKAASPFAVFCDFRSLPHGKGAASNQISETVAQNQFFSLFRNSRLHCCHIVGIYVKISLSIYIINHYQYTLSILHYPYIKQQHIDGQNKSGGRHGRGWG